MRSYAPFSLLALVLVGCGVPDPSIPAPEKATPVAEVKKETPKRDDPVVKGTEGDVANPGLKITDTKVGTGAVAENGDTLTMKYAGRLKSTGAEFDSNMKPDGKPFTFPLGQGQVIKGWDLGVKGMRVGGKRTLEIPAALGYGATGAGEKIPPNSDLVFDIELMDVQKIGDASTVLRETLKPGTGPEVKSGDVVTIKYKITLPDGKLIDDNKGKAAQFKVGSPVVALPGLNVALIGMKKGQTVRATIPPALGLKPTGPDSVVPPNSTIKVDITLVGIG